MNAKNMLRLVMALCLLILFSAPVYANAIPVTTWEELFNVRNDLSADYILMNDLDESSVGYDIYVGSAVNAGGWLPIGEFVPAPATDTLVQGEWDADVSLSSPFSGSFDGGSHTLSGLFINRPGDGIQPMGYGIGLFGYVNGGQISNLELVNADITGHRHVGVLAGYTWQTDISNVQISGKLVTNHNGGGLAGTIRQGSLIQNCSSSAAVVGDVIVRNSLRTGGLIGAVHNSAVEDSFTSGRVQGDFYDTGGLAGSIYEGTHITRCYTTGTVYGTGAVGALIGSTNQASVIVDCYTTGDVIATGREIGGLIGNINNGTSVTHCFATGNVSGGGLWVGGLIGIVCNGSTVDSSYALGNVTSTNDLAAGLVGHLSTGASIHNSYARGSVAARGGAGGLVGLMDDGLVAGSYATGSSSGGYSVGGLIGASNASTVADSYWDIASSMLSGSSGGTGLTTAQMVQASSFPNWDFADLWQIKTDVTYPYFLWQGDVNIPYAPEITPNNLPNAVDDSYSVSKDSVSNFMEVLANDSDPDGDSLSLQSVDQPGSGTVIIVDNKASYTPALGYSGPDSFGYIVSDGKGGSDTATVSITVTSVNGTPNAVDDSYSVSKDSVSNVLDVLANDSDPDGDSLSLQSVDQPGSGTVSIADNKASYTPALGYNGPDSFGYIVSDGKGGSDTATVSITVTSVNGTPNAVDDSYSVSKDSVSNVLDVLANDSDPDGDSLSLQSVDQPGSGTVSIADNKASYTPTPGYSGPDSFGYTVSDGKGGSDTATVSITVASVNGTPNAVDDSYSVSKDSVSNVLDVLANDSDPDGDSLSLQSVDQPGSGTVSIADNKVSYTPTSGYIGPDSFGYTVSDGKGGGDTAVVTLLVVNRTAVIEITLSTASRNAGSAGKNLFVRAIADVNVGVENATVSGTWSGAAIDADTGITGAAGNVKLTSDEVKYRDKPLQFTFTVKSVSVNGIEYELGGEISETFSFTK